MVDFNRENDSQAATNNHAPPKGEVSPAQKGEADERRVVADVVCPICFKQIDHPVIMAEGPDGEGRRLRTYFGYCPQCSVGHVVIQFAREDRWVIHKFRPSVVLGVANIIEIVNDWTMLSELPVVKAEVTPDKNIRGQGSEKLEGKEAGVMEALAEMHKAMVSCATTIELLLRSMAEKRGQSIDG